MTQSYYGRPVVKPHAWKPYIPWYFWVGGVSGAAAVHAFVERVRGNDELANVQRNVAQAGVLIAPVLLIADLGVKSRFINMMRVFKPSSPMSVGTWILTGFGGAITTATVADLLGWKAIARAGEAGAALLGPALATYTAVLVADTATPVWHAAYEDLPHVFAASAVAGAGAMGTLFAPHASSGAARRMATAGALAMTVSARRMERRLGAFLAEPYNQGKGGSFKRMSGALAMTGAVLGLLGGKNATVARVAAGCVAASGIFERFAVTAAGKQSAADPKYTVRPQRERVDARGPTRPSE